MLLVRVLKVASTKWKNIGVGLEISRLVSSQYIQEKSFQAKKIIRTMFFIFFCRKSAVKIGAKFHNCTRASLIRSGFKTKGASTFYRIFFNLRKFTAVVRNEPLGWDHHHSIPFFLLFYICLPRPAPLSQSSAALRLNKEIFANLSRLRIKEF